MRRNQVFLYPLPNKVVFPYNEYQITMNTSAYDCNHIE